MVGLSCLSFVGNPFRGHSGTDEKEMTALISVGRMARAVPSVADEWAVKNAAGRAFYYPIPAGRGAELLLY